MVNLASPDSKRKLLPYYIDPLDNKFYYWELLNNTDIFGKWVYFVLWFFLGYFFIQGLFWGVLKIISFLSEKAAFWIGVVLLLSLIPGLIFLVIEGEKHPQKRIYFSSGLMVFSGTLFFLLSSPVSMLQEGFTTTTGYDSLEWLKFFVQQGINVLLLDIPDTFNFSISNIQPVTWYGKSITILLKVLVSSGFLYLNVQLFDSIFLSKKFYGTYRECIKVCQARLDIFGFLSEDPIIKYVLIRKKLGSDNQDIYMNPSDFLDYLKSTNRHSDLFDN